MQLAITDCAAVNYILIFNLQKIFIRVWVFLYSTQRNAAINSNYVPSTQNGNLFVIIITKTTITMFISIHASRPHPARVHCILLLFHSPLLHLSYGNVISLSNLCSATFWQNAQLPDTTFIHYVFFAMFRNSIKCIFTFHHTQTHSSCPCSSSVKNEAKGEKKWQLNKKTDEETTSPRPRVNMDENICQTQSFILMSNQYFQILEPKIKINERKIAVMRILQCNSRYELALTNKSFSCKYFLFRWKNSFQCVARQSCVYSSLE